MNIVIYAYYFLPRRGGVPQATNLMARALSELGHDVTVLTSTVSDGSDNEGVWPYQVIRDNRLITILRIIRQADMLFIRGGMTSRICGLAMFARTDVVIVHEMAGSIYRMPLSILNICHNCLRYLFAHSSVLHIAVSNCCMESKKLPKNIHKAVLYNPVDPELFCSSIKSEQNNPQYDVLYVGRLIKSKGIFDLAVALRKFDSEQRSLSVAIAGFGEDEAQLFESLCGLSTVKVYPLGSLDRTKLGLAYSSARVVVVPSSSHPEGMGMVIAEALAFGIPVIGSDQPVIVEVVDSAGLIFRKNNSRDLYDNLKRLLNDADLRKRLSKQAVRQARKFEYIDYRTKLQTLVDSVSQ